MDILAPLVTIQNLAPGNNTYEVTIPTVYPRNDSDSWSKSELFKKHIYNNIMFENNTVAKLKGLYNYLYEKIPTDFQRREFKEFSYIKINLPIWIFFLVISIFFVTLLTTYFLINQNN